MPNRSALRLLSQCLAGALGQPLDIKDLPANEAEWQRVLQLSSTHFVTPLLRWALQEKSLMSALPSEIVEYLDAFHALNLDDNRLYEDQLAHLIQVLNQVGVRPVLLKGAATLVGSLYPSIAERFIGDIDILIPAPKLPEIINQLRAAGYTPGDVDDFPSAEDFAGQATHHCPPVRSMDWPVWVELHLHPVHLNVSRLLSSEEMIQDATPLNWRGGECLIPSPTHFVMHNVIHAFLVDYDSKAFLSLRQLFEFVHACRNYAGQIDWTAIQQRFDGCHAGAKLRCYMALANIYLGFQAPAELPIGEWSRLRARFHCAWVDAPVAIYFPIRLFGLAGSGLKNRLRNLKRNPRKLKKLLSSGIYVNFYRELCTFKKRTF